MTIKVRISITESQKQTNRLTKVKHNKRPKWLKVNLDLTETKKGLQKGKGKVNDPQWLLIESTRSPADNNQKFASVKWESTNTKLALTDNARNYGIA